MRRAHSLLQFAECSTAQTRCKRKPHLSGVTARGMPSYIERRKVTRGHPPPDFGSCALPSPAAGLAVGMKLKPSGAGSSLGPSGLVYPENSHSRLVRVSG